FKRFSEHKIKITVAKHNHGYIGYCISTISDVNGEIASIHIDESYRGIGVGRRLVVDHLNWMKEGKCKTMGVTVSQENVSTISFYKKLGFYPNTLYMQQKF
ncbi:MAG: GNAT family N-acetyltransferase, partial [Gudongella sp.]|nr:GNAT family N-acetyltransferase [Gudongella sp.]